MSNPNSRIPNQDFASESPTPTYPTPESPNYFTPAKVAHSGQNYPVTYPTSTDNYPPQNYPQVTTPTIHSYPTKNYSAPAYYPDPNVVQRESTQFHSKQPKQKRKGRLVIVILLLLLVIGGTGSAIAYHFFLSDKESPKSVAENFFQKIIAGDVETAAKLYQNTDDPAITILLRNDVYAQTKQRLSAYKIIQVNEAKNKTNLTATVKAAVTIAGSDYPINLQLEKSLKSSASESSWKITKTNYHNYVSLNFSPGQITVNGIDVTLPKTAVQNQNSDSIVLPIFPGVYEFKGKNLNKYLSFGDPLTTQIFPAANSNPFTTQNLVTDNSQTSESNSSSQSNLNQVVFTPKFNHQLQDDITSLVEARWEKCLPNQHFTVPECAGLNMDDPLSYAVTAINRSWIQKPTLELQSMEPELTLDGKYRGTLIIKDGLLKIAYKFRFTESEEWRDSSITIRPYQSIYRETQMLPFTVTSNGDLHIDWSRF